jgi:CheY-like chemotaxis protein
VVSYNATTFHDRDRKLKGVFAAARDVTERKLFDRTLQEKNVELQLANIAKREFLAVMSHEIRTPMNGILGMTELTLNTELTPSQRDYLKVVKSSAESLLTLLNDLLDFSKIEAGKLELETIAFNLRETLGNTLQTLATRAKEKDLKLSLHINPDVPDILGGDPHRLRQIVVNLVGNALKFTERGEIAVQVEYKGDIGGQALVRFAVIDTGIGIAPAAHTSIFSAFEQADTSTTRRYGGTGLGLAITRQIVELMGGEIKVESEQGHGSTFSFTARFGRLEIGDNTRKDSVAPFPIPRQRALCILLAEDNAVNQQVAVANLESWGHRVTIVNDGRAAIAAVESTRFDLVLMDSQMPGMGGFESTAAIRQHELGTTVHLPIIAMTANVMKGFREECLAAGMDGYVSKPVRLPELIAAMVAAVPNLLPGAVAPTVASSTPPMPKDHSDHPFDVAALLASAGGNRALARKMAKLCYEADGPRLSRELAVAAEQGDLSGIERAAHAISGLVGEFHAAAASRLAQILAETARRLRTDAVQAQAMALEREFQRLLAALQIFAGEPDEIVAGEFVTEQRRDTSPAARQSLI